MTDIYQERYLEHQQRKADSLKSTVGDDNWAIYDKHDLFVVDKMFKNRRSQRTFNRNPVTREELEKLLGLLVHCPSSCNRQGIQLKIVYERDDKDLLSGVFVGGVGWCHRADKLLLLFADMEAYKSPYERDFMPYLDAGAMIQSIYLLCEVLGIGCAYINPNIRDANKELFNSRFNKSGLLYCGSMALGHYDLKSIAPEKRSIDELLIP